MPLPEAYVNASPKAMEYCDNCKHYSNNHCVKFNEKVAPYGWCAVWEPIDEIRSIKIQ
jgi:hypothetical protein